MLAMRVRTKALPIVVALMVLSATVSLSAKKNTIAVGPNYEKGQRSDKTLTFVAPTGWSNDAKAAAEYGLYNVLVPEGKNLDNTDKAITIAFQKKDANKPGLADLKSFFRADLNNMVAQFPDLQGARWQPSHLDPDKINFFSLEMYGKEKDKPSPARVLYLDSGDGFFSITLTAETRDELQQPAYAGFLQQHKPQIDSGGTCFAGNRRSESKASDRNVRPTWA
jgi:hypothetical protein